MSTVRDLLGGHRHIIGELRIIGGDKGVFDVTVDGEVLFSKHVEGRHADPGEVLRRFAERYAHDVHPEPS